MRWLKHRLRGWKKRARHPDSSTLVLMECTRTSPVFLPHFGTDCCPADACLDLPLRSNFTFSGAGKSHRAPLIAPTQNAPPYSRTPSENHPQKARPQKHPSAKNPRRCKTLLKFADILCGACLGRLARLPFCLSLKSTTGFSRPQHRPAKRCPPSLLVSWIRAYALWWLCTGHLRVRRVLPDVSVD